MSTRTMYIVLGCVTILSAPILINASVSTTGEEQNRIPSGYIYNPDVGYHKLYNRERHTWDGAKRVCQEEHAELSIVNSKAEADVLSKYLREVNEWEAFVGINDIDHEGQWVTNHGLPIEKTGFNEWDESEPSNAGENCGAFRNNGKLNDVPCNEHNLFFCELIIP